MGNIAREIDVFLRKPRQYDTLTLWQKNLEVKRFAELARVIQESAFLKSLDFESSTIGYEGVRHLAEALKFNRTLVILNLSYTFVGDEGTRHLAEALKANSALIELHLSGSKIGNKGVKYLAEALEENSTLTELYLSGNAIGDEGAKHLAVALEANSALKRLHLFSNKIGYEGVRCLAEVIGVNSSLIYLDLDHNHNLSYQHILSLVTKHSSSGIINEPIKYMNSQEMIELFNGTSVDTYVRIHLSPGKVLMYKRNITNTESAFQKAPEQIIEEVKTSEILDPGLIGNVCDENDAC